MKGMNHYSPNPFPSEEDTPDLTAEDVAKAVPTKNGEDFGQHLRGLKCSICGSSYSPPVEHKLCRRASRLYSRARGTCPNGHAETSIFLVDWLKR